MKSEEKSRRINFREKIFEKLEDVDLDIVVKISSWFSLIMLLVIGATFILHLIGIILDISSEGSFKIFTVIGNILFKEFRAITLESILTSIMVMILLSYFGIRTVFSFIIASIVLSVISAIGGSFLGLINPPKNIEQLFIYSLSGLLNYSNKLYRLLVSWASSQKLELTSISISMSVIAFITMMVDKHQARLGEDAERVPEKVIKRFAIIGGGLGILAGAYVFRHKTKHTSLLIQVALFTIPVFMVMLGA